LPEVIDRGVAAGGGDVDGTVTAELSEQGGGVVGDAGAGGRERRV